MKTAEPGDALLQQEGYDLMAAAFDVHNELGSGFLEEVYHEALEIELSKRSIPFVSRSRLHLHFKDARLKREYIADLVVYSGIIVELKAVRSLVAEHEAQLLNYLKATGKRVGYLIHFGGFPNLEWKRMVL